MPRPAGVPNRNSLEFRAALKKKNFNVPEALMWCFEQAKERFLLAEKDADAASFLNIATTNAKEMASFCFPKLRSTEHSKDNSDVPLEKQIEALEELLKIKKNQVKNASTL